ncbi:uncharacterized protein [Littorina saxatilis]|uniref:Vertnin n=1 Tax=Littorina saxatilis TaxID=31220 RepID=A0AAN9GH19_9CAEN
MPLLHGKGNLQHACAKCSEYCQGWEGVFCDVCGNWHHVKCEQLEIQILQAFKELPEVPYICKSCRSDERGSFSYDGSISRLHKAAKQGIEKLYIYVERERLFMKEDLAYHNVRVPKYSSDVQAQALLQEYCPSQKKNAAKVTKDNNSLFSAVSVALGGNEKLAKELRVRCCIEMVVHESFYKWQDNYEQLTKCAPDYMESCLNCATPDEDSCVWTMSALASVVRRHIESIYPAVNGKMDRAISILNRVFVPRNKIDSGENLKIFWSSSKKTTITPGSWVPDMFVPLVDMPIVPLSPTVMSPFNTPSRVSGRMRKPTAKVMAITSPREKNQMKVVVENTDPGSEDELHDGDDSDFEMPSSFTLEPADNEEAYMNKYHMENIDINWMDKFTVVAKGGNPLTGTAFLSAQEIFNVLTTETEILPNIPAGKKEDVYYVVDNSRNMRYKHRRNYFQDDCGRYNQKSGTTCKSYYLLTADNMLQPMIKHGDKYCRESKRVPASTGVSPRGRGRPPGRGRGRGRGASEQKVTKWIPMEPQPDEDKIIILHRYYSQLEIDPTYKRRISWFINLPERLEKGHSVFLAEYLTKPVPGLQLPLNRKRQHTTTMTKAAERKSTTDAGSDDEMTDPPAKKKRMDGDATETLSTEPDAGEAEEQPENPPAQDTSPSQDENQKSHTLEQDDGKGAEGSKTGQKATTMEDTGEAQTAEES